MESGRPTLLKSLAFVEGGEDMVSTWAPSILSFMKGGKWVEPWRMVELARRISVFILHLVSWFIKTVVTHLPLASSFFLHVVGRAPYATSLYPLTAMSSCEEKNSLTAENPRSSESAIGRALCQVLALVNNIPVSSDKYEFTRTLADKIIQENIEEGDEYLKEVNRGALSAGLYRTLGLLTSALEEALVEKRLMQGSGKWPRKLVRLFSPRSPLSLESARLHISSLSSMFLRAQGDLADSLEPPCVEKLAHELLWIVHKLNESSNSLETIAHWSSASNLAFFSLSANPRVQAPLLRISVIIFKEIALGKVEASVEMKFKLLMLWLPLLCCVKPGYDGPSLSGLEKAEVVSTLEKIIASLPNPEQERVLSTWLHEFTLSSSDWPNLQHCYQHWCRSSRHLA